MESYMEQQGMAPVLTTWVLYLALILLQTLSTSTFADRFDFLYPLGTPASYSSLMQASNGLLYGFTTASGGAPAGIFSFNLSTNVYTNLRTLGSTDAHSQHNATFTDVPVVYT